MADSQCHGKRHIFDKAECVNAREIKYVEGTNEIPHQANEFEIFPSNPSSFEANSSLTGGHNYFQDRGSLTEN
jgi:hypothetical protein